MQHNTTLTDALGVVIEVGDRITVIHAGWEARLADCGRTATVTGFTRAGNVKHDGGEQVANGYALRPGCLAVARRDGTFGHEGNRRDQA